MDEQHFVPEWCVSGFLISYSHSYLQTRPPAHHTMPTLRHVNYTRHLQNLSQPLLAARGPTSRHVNWDLLSACSSLIPQVHCNPSQPNVHASNSPPQGHRYSRESIAIEPIATTSSLESIAIATATSNM